MQMLKHNQDLFGGALFRAGIVAAAITTTATAEFLFVPAASPFGADNLLRVVGSGSSAYVGGSNTSPDGFPGPRGYTGSGLTMSAYAYPLIIGTHLTLTDANTWDIFAYTVAYQWFTVECEANVVLEWDFTNTEIGIGNVYQLGVGFIYEAAEPTAGSVTLNIEPGNLYVFVGCIQQHGINGSGFVNLTTSPPPECPADIAESGGATPDGDVNVFDLLELLANWGTNGPGADIAPLSNVVDVFDLLDLLAAWGSCT